MQPNIKIHMAAFNRIGLRIYSAHVIIFMMLFASEVDWWAAKVYVTHPRTGDSTPDHEYSPARSLTIYVQNYQPWDFKKIYQQAICECEFRENYHQIFIFW